MSTPLPNIFEIFTRRQNSKLNQGRQASLDQFFVSLLQIYLDSHTLHVDFVLEAAIFWVSSWSVFVHCSIKIPFFSVSTTRERPL